MANFLNAIESGIQASLDKEKNIKEILTLVDQVSSEIKSFSEGKIELKLTSPFNHLNMFLQSMAIAQTQKESSGTDKPSDKILKAVLTNNDKVSEKLTILEFGSQGYPCTITVDGDKLTAGDHEGLERIFLQLLASPITGKILRKLTTIYDESKS